MERVTTFEISIHVYVKSDSTRKGEIKFRMFQFDIEEVFIEL